MGDYNINTLNKMIGTSTHNQHFSNILSSHYHHKLIDLPTKERKESSTLLFIQTSQIAITLVILVY